MYATSALFDMTSVLSPQLWNVTEQTLCGECHSLVASVLLLGDCIYRSRVIRLEMFPMGLYVQMAPSSKEQLCCRLWVEVLQVAPFHGDMHQSFQGLFSQAVAVVRLHPFHCTWRNHNCIRDWSIWVIQCFIYVCILGKPVTWPKYYNAVLLLILITLTAPFLFPKQFKLSRYSK